MSWYVVQTKPNRERWARANLWERGLQVYLPQYRKRRCHARKVDVVSAPLFPGYLFVNADLEQAGRRVFDSTPGSIGLVTFGSATPSVPERVLAEIRHRENHWGFVQLCNPSDLKANDSVGLVNGPFGEL